MDGLADLAAIAEAQLEVALLVFLRVLGVAALMPALGERSLSVRIRIVVALGMAVVVYPAVADRLGPVPPGALTGLVISETMIGLVMGLMMRLIVMALQICGSIIAQVSSLSQLMGFATAEPLPVVGHILSMAGLTLLVMADIHVAVARALVQTYDAFPLGTILAPGDLAELATRRIAGLFSLAFSLSAPFVLAALLYNLALGAINRAMPQLMVALVGAPAILLATLALLALTAPLLLSLWLTVAQTTIADPFGAR